MNLSDSQKQQVSAWLEQGLKVADVQKKMAAELGASQRAYAAWETGRTKPDDIVAVAKRIALRWGIPPTWTLGLDDSPPPPDGDGGQGSRLGESNPPPIHYKGTEIPLFDGLIAA